MNIGESWGVWKIDQLIGEGSFGKVYKIIREELGHTYEAALKVIEIPQSQSEVESVKNEGMDDLSVSLYFQSIVEDFVEEFALMSKLKGNSNIVSYEDHQVVPKEDGVGVTVYIRMELLTPLYAYLKTNALSVQGVVRLGIDICQALEVCQEYQIIHRDIKPENIFVSGVGQFKLGDFGIARQLEKTSSGLSKKGTYTYMAPEVYKGLPYNPTVDIYSLGIVLYRFLNNNRAPFMPPFPQPIRYSDKEKANFLRLNGEAVPYPANAKERLAAIILKACAYEPGDRYQSAAKMKEALQAVLYSEPKEQLVCSIGSGFSSTGVSCVAGSDTISDEPEENETVYLFQSQNKERERKRAEEKERLEAKEREKQEAEAKIRLEVEERKRREDELQEKQGTKQKLEQDARNREEQKVRKKEKNRLRVKRAGTVVAIILLVICVAGGMKIYQNSLKRIVPDLLNISAEKAQKILEEEDLNAVLSEEYSDTVQKGLIISQQYKAGTTVEKGAEIGIVVSKGALVTIPDLVNMTEADAKTKLEELRLDFEVKDKSYSDQVKKDMIISQEPIVGNKVEEGSTVYVVLSEGVEKKEVPSLVGLTSQEAKKKLEDAQLNFKSKKEYSDSVKKGVVISQDIAKGKKIDKNSTVNVAVSDGEKPVVKKAAVKKPIARKQQRTTKKSAPKKKTTKKKKSTKKKKKSGDSVNSWNLVN